MSKMKPKDAGFRSQGDLKIGKKIKISLSIVNEYLQKKIYITTYGGKESVRNIS